VSPVKCELEIYFPEVGILHSHLRKNLNSYIISTIFPVSDFRFCSSYIEVNINIAEYNSDRH
jgi:hypothetical protein